MYQCSWGQPQTAEPRRAPPAPKPPWDPSPTSQRRDPCSWRNCAAGRGKRCPSPNQQAEAASPPWPCGHQLGSLPGLVVGQPAGYRGSWSRPPRVRAGLEEKGGTQSPGGIPPLWDTPPLGPTEVSYCLTWGCCTSPEGRVQFLRSQEGASRDLPGSARRSPCGCGLPAR